MKAQVEKLPFLERLEVFWDIDSGIKHIWLTGYILITWSVSYNLRETLKTIEIFYYKSGSYE